MAIETYVNTNLKKCAHLVPLIGPLALPVAEGRDGWNIHISKLKPLLMAVPINPKSAGISFYGNREHIAHCIRNYPNWLEGYGQPTEEGLEFLSGMYSWIVPDDTGKYYSFGVLFSTPRPVADNL